MARLTLEDLMAGPQPPAPTGGKRLTLDDLMAGPQPSNEESSSWPEMFGISKQGKAADDQMRQQWNSALKAGAANNLSGLTRILNKMGFSATLTLKAKQLADKENESYKQSGASSKLSTEFLEGLTEYGMAAAESDVAVDAAGAAALKAAAPLLKKELPQLAAKWISAQANRNMATRSLARGLKTIPAGGAFGAITASPDQSISSGAAIGALLTPGSVIASDIIGKGIQGLSKSGAVKKLAEKTNVPIEILKKRLKDWQKTPMLLGKAIEDDDAVKAELNVIPNAVGFSQKGKEKLNGITTSLTKQSKKLFNLLSNGQDRADLIVGTQQLIDEAESKINVKKDELYQHSNELADKHNLQIPLENFSKEAKRKASNFSEIYEKMGLSGPADAGAAAARQILEHVYGVSDDEKSAQLRELDKNFKSGFIRDPNGAQDPYAIGMEANRPYYEKLKKDIQEQPRKPNKVSLRVANLGKGYINDKWYEAKKAGNNSLSSVYNDLRNALKEDISDGLKDVPEEVKDANNAAEDYFKNIVSAFRNQNILRATHVQSDTDMLLARFLPLSKNGKDRISLMESLINNVPGSADMLLSNALREGTYVDDLGRPVVDPPKLYNVLNKIGPERLRKILDKSTRLKPSDYDKIKTFQNNMNNGYDAFVNMLNPPTGAKNSQLMGAYYSFEYWRSLIHAIGALDADALVGAATGPFVHQAMWRAIGDSADTLEKIIKIKMGMKVAETKPYKIAKLIRKSGKATGLASTAGINNLGV